MTDDAARKQDLLAVLRLVEDAEKCLVAAHQELRLRKPTQAAFAVGAVGTAQASVRFVANMIRASIGILPPPKKEPG